MSRVESGAMAATLIVVALYKAVLNLPGALRTEMYSFGAVYLRAEIFSQDSCTEWWSLRRSRWLECVAGMAVISR